MQVWPNGSFGVRLLGGTRKGPTPTDPALHIKYPGSWGRPRGEKCSRKSEMVGVLFREWVPTDLFPLSQCSSLWARGVDAAFPLFIAMEAGWSAILRTTLLSRLTPDFNQTPFFFQDSLDAF